MDPATAVRRLGPSSAPSSHHAAALKRRVLDVLPADPGRPLPLRPRPRYDICVIRTLAPWLSLVATFSLACGSSPAPAAPEQPPPDDVGSTRRAVDLALASLSRRNFDVTGCVPTAARLVPEAEARAGAPSGGDCAILVARNADRTWLVVVRSAHTSKSYGALARVTVASEGEGVMAIEYAQ